MVRIRRLGRAVAVGLFVSACSDGARTVIAPSSDLFVNSVVPTGGSVAVDPAAPLVIAFSHPMMSGMEALVMLHKGSVTGSQVLGTSAWSSDRTRLTFWPVSPLEHGTMYVLHLSPNLKDTNGDSINWSGCAPGIGGQPVEGAAYGWGMMGGGMGPGMMGSAWQPGSGMWAFGMSLTFTTR